ncbi:hypothetical protein [Skermanella rosea]|nr:hypothetical protein [Skermanella rosea]
MPRDPNDGDGFTQLQWAAAALAVLVFTFAVLVALWGLYITPAA